MCATFRTREVEEIGSMNSKNEYRLPPAIVLDPADTVAVLLADVEAGTEIQLVGAVGGRLSAGDPIRFGHKIALRDHRKGDQVRKYGEVIGRASVEIARGRWAHLHNIASNFDQLFLHRIQLGEGKTP